MPKVLGCRRSGGVLGPSLRGDGCGASGGLIPRGGAPRLKGDPDALPHVAPLPRRAGRCRPCRGGGKPARHRPGGLARRAHRGDGSPAGGLASRLPRSGTRAQAGRTARSRSRRNAATLIPKPRPVLWPWPGAACESGDDHGGDSLVASTVTDDGEEPTVTALTRRPVVAFTTETLFAPAFAFARSQPRARVTLPNHG